MHGYPETDCDSEVMITAKVVPVKEPPYQPQVILFCCTAVNCVDDLLLK